MCPARCIALIAMCPAHCNRCPSGTGARTKATTTDASAANAAVKTPSCPHLGVYAQIALSDVQRHTQGERQLLPPQLPLARSLSRRNRPRSHRTLA